MFSGSKWWITGSDNILTAEYGTFWAEVPTIAGGIDSQYKVTKMDDNGDFYKIEVLYTANTNSGMVGASIYLKRQASMNSSVQTVLENNSHFVL